MGQLPGMGAATAFLEVEQGGRSLAMFSSECILNIIGRQSSRLCFAWLLLSLPTFIR